MAQKHLHELLKEDQEPFLLKNYIADRRSQLKTCPPKTHLQVKRRKPIYESSNFTGKFCKNTCFFSSQETLDLRKSPLFQFSSPAKSPCKSPNSIFFHVPSRTAALLLEAALRIQKHSSASKSKTESRSQGFGLFGSFLRRLTNRNRTRNRELEGNGVKISVKDILKWDSPASLRKISHGVQQEQAIDAKDKTTSQVSVLETCFASSYRNRRTTSTIWSESNEEKSLDLETSSSSGQSQDSGDFDDFAFKQRENTECDCCDDSFCESPFRFALQMSPSSCRMSPDFKSPVSSPTSLQAKDEDNNNGAESLKDFETEEDKEQLSPVSVLDPPFEDDDERRENDDEVEEDDGYYLERSYANVQRAKQQLLQKLHRFEKLAGLDPVVLENRMLDDEVRDDEDYESFNFQEEEEYGDENMQASVDDVNLVRLVTQVMCNSCHKDINERIITEDMKKLISDLILEEERETFGGDDDGGDDDNVIVVKRVCKRLELWNDVESNTIDMMVEQDYLKEHQAWKRNPEERAEMARALELAIFSFLVQELSEELVCLKEV